MRALRFAPLCLSLSAAVASLLGSSSHGALLVYEGFDYPVGANLIAQTGGEGFKQVEGGSDLMPWFDLRSPEDIEDSATLQLGNLPRPANASNLEMSGNSLLLKPLVEGRYRPLGITAPDSGSLWMSFVMVRTVGLTSNNRFHLVLSATPAWSNRTDALIVGVGNADNRYFLGGNSASAESVTTSVNGVPDLLVVKMTLQPGNDRFDLFVNPSFGIEPQTPDATLTQLDLSALNYLGIVSSSTGATRRWGLDEIRIGDTYADVTPTAVPEPTAGLMGLVGAAALGFRRRRR